MMHKACEGNYVDCRVSAEPLKTFCIMLELHWFICEVIALRLLLEMPYRVFQAISLKHLTSSTKLKTQKRRYTVRMAKTVFECLKKPELLLASIAGELQHVRRPKTNKKLVYLLFWPCEVLRQ